MRDGWSLQSMGGRYSVLCFFGSSTAEPLRDRLSELFTSIPFLVDDRAIAFFGVSVDGKDEQRLVAEHPELRWIWDRDGRVSASFGLVHRQSDGSQRYQATTFVLDPTLRVVGNLPLIHPEHNERLRRFLGALPPADDHAGVGLHAPVLIVPRIFEPAFCRELIAFYERTGGKDSGFMRDVDGKTVLVVDHRFKRRADAPIEDDALRDACRARLQRRLVPEIQKVFNFKPTRIERYIVACYEAETGGHFHAHRDNTTRGTAHRRFAVSLNLDSDAHEGGDLRFPEFGSRTYRAPSGGAVVFSCSLLHEATPVTRGVRHAFLPFLYDEEAAKIRQRNNVHLGEGVGAYRE